MSFYEVDYTIYINDGMETLSESIVSGQIATKNGGVVDGEQVMHIFNQSYNVNAVDFKDNVLSATKGLGGERGDIFRTSAVQLNDYYDIEYVGSATTDSPPDIVIDKNNGRILPCRGINYIYNTNAFLPGYKLTLSGSSSIYINWGAEGGLNYTSYVCVNDDDASLLETGETWASDRSGVNDVVIYDKLTHSPSDNTVIVFSYPLPAITSGATITADLTSITNNIYGEELIIRTQINYAHPTSALYNFYTGDRKRNTIYNTGQTSDPGSYGIYTSGISRFLMKASTGEFIMEDWNDGDYNEFEGTQAYPPFIIVPTGVNVDVYPEVVSGIFDLQQPIISATALLGCDVKDHYIQLCGISPEEIRYGANKYINLVDYLPQYLQNSETEVFLKFFQDFLNTMFEGNQGYTVSGIDVDIENLTPVSASNTKYYTISAGTSAIETSAYTSASDVQELTYSIAQDDVLDNIEIPMLSADGELLSKRISILQKVMQLTELQDPDLVDIDYIQFFAKNLGYDIEISRSQIGTGFGNATTLYADDGEAICNDDENRYLRFVVRNLPSWYKIKTTNNAVKVMLYSFGLIGDLVEHYSNDYQYNWKIDNDGDLSQIPANYYPTSHFSIVINIDNSVRAISFDYDKRQKIIDSIESVRPINTVFERLTAYAVRLFEKKVALNTRIRYYEIIK